LTPDTLPLNAFFVDPPFAEEIDPSKNALEKVDPSIWRAPKLWRAPIIHGNWVSATNVEDVLSEPHAPKVEKYGRKCAKSAQWVGQFFPA